MSTLALLEAHHAAVKEAVAFAEEVAKNAERNAKQANLDLANARAKGEPMSVLTRFLVLRAMNQNLCREMLGQAKALPRLTYTPDSRTPMEHVHAEIQRVYERYELKCDFL